jgi:hypothetical protein
MAKKDLKYFMRDSKEEIVTVAGPDTFRDEDGNVIQLEIKKLTQAEIQRINENYHHKGIATDKKGNPIVQNGSIVWKEEKDSARASRHIIAEALVYPDLHDKELMAFYNEPDITQMPLRVFSKPDEYAHVARAVMTALGLMDDLSDEELSEEAKN